MRAAAPRSPMSVGLMVGLALLLALGTPPSVLAALSASVDDLSLASGPYSHQDRVVTGSLGLTATDTGTLVGTTNAGWNVTIQSSSFAYSGPNNGTPIPAANLAITAAHPPTRVSGQAISPTGGPRTTNVTGSLATPRKTLQADGPSGLITLTYYGIGTYRQMVDVSLLVPGRTRAGTYTATLVVTISQGP
jgi:hypothetical protein